MIFKNFATAVAQQFKAMEREAAKVKAEASARKDRILEIIAKKQDHVLEETSLEELQKMVEAI